jgi:hypothetical protein
MVETEDSVCRRVRVAPQGMRHLAAAQIAGRAGLRWKQFPRISGAQASAVNFRIHIRRLTRKTGTVAPNFTASGVGFWSIASAQNPAINVPDVAGLHKALTDVDVP